MICNHCAKDMADWHACTGRLSSCETIWEIKCAACGSIWEVAVEDEE